MPGQARASVAACPLCGDHDGITHVLGNCGHTTGMAMNTETLNAAVRPILRLMLEGSKSSRYMLADVGSTNKLGSVGPLDSRLPEWLVPTHILLQEGSDRDKLRPDVLMTSSIAAVQHEQVRQVQAPTPRANIHGGRLPCCYQTS